MIAVESLMTTGVLSVRDNDTVSDAQSTMNAAGIRHLPVADEHFHVVGIISNRDLKGVGPRSRGKRVGAVMTRDVICVRPGDPASKAAELMLDRKLGALPVVDSDETLIGIVTETDFLRVALQALTTAGRGRNGATGPQTR
jgi:CBS domain-containing protein